MRFWLLLLLSFPTLPVAAQELPGSVEVNSLERYPGSTDLSDNPLMLYRSSSPTLMAQSSPVSLPTWGQFGLQSSRILFFAGITIALLLLLLIAIWAYTRVYVITPTNEAFVRTGGGTKKGKKVILNGGDIVLPGFHELTRVPLRELSIDVERTGKLAVRTQDYLRADMRVTFFVCIKGQEQDVLTAAARLSQNGKITPNDIKNALEKRADDAIRAAAKSKKLAEIDSDKLGFAQEVLNLIEPDLKKVGLTLNNIAISEVEESDTYDTNNFFDAQGVRLRTETIQQSIQQKREVELATKITLEQKELEAEKQSLLLQQEKESANLEQQLQVESLKAQREREIEEARAKEQAATQRSKILQNKSVEEEEIRKRLGIEQSQIDADIELEERRKQLKVVQAQQQQEAEQAEITRQQSIEETRVEQQAAVERSKILQARAVEEESIQKQLALQQKQIEADIALEEQNKQLRLAQILQQQESEQVEVSRKQAITAAELNSQLQITEAERQARIAQEETQIAIANKRQESFLAEAERAKAEAAVLSATQVEEAERAQRLAIIAAEQEAQKRSIAERNLVEIEAFRRKKQAEIAQQAAEIEAQSIRTLAEAEKDKALAEAEGIAARIGAENSISTPNLTAGIIKEVWPDLVKQLPETLEALAPKPGVLGDARIYSFSGGNGSDPQNINKLLMSTSALELLSILLDEGKLGSLLAQVKQLVQPPTNGSTNHSSSHLEETTTGSLPSQPDVE